MEQRRGGATTALKRYGPLVAGVLAAQVVAAWIVLTVLAPDAPHKGSGDDLVVQADAQRIAWAARYAAEETLPHYYAPLAFRGIAVNPAGTNSRRYLQVSLELGLKAYDRSKQPPRDDITARFGKESEALATLERYTGKMRGIIVEVLAATHIETLDRRELIPIQEQIRDRLNREVLQLAFRDPTSTRAVIVVEVLFVEMLIQ